MATSILHVTSSAACSRQAIADQLTYRPDIDGLRAVAALAVIGGHADLLAGGTAGVDIFFVISGFLISGIILRSLAQGNFSCFDFYLRRIRRIFPALIVVLLTVWGLGWLIFVKDEYQALGRDILTSSAFVHNFYVYEWVPRFAKPIDNFSREMLGHIWSLGVEEQFYLIWPVLLIMVWKSGKSLAALIVGVTTVSFLLNAIATTHNFQAAYFLPWNRLWELSLGAGLAYIQPGHLNVPRSGVPSLLRDMQPHAYGLAGATLILASITRLDFAGAFPGWWALAPSIGSVLIIAAGPQSWVNRYILSASPLVFVGLISYPLYLWHVPLLFTGHVVSARWSPPISVTAVAVAITFGFAALTYRYVELPVRSLKPKTAAPYLCALLCVCGCLGYLAGNSRIPARLDTPRVDRLIVAANENWLPGGSGNTWTPTANGLITLGTGERHVLFLGDHNMQQYFPRISRYLADHPSSVHSATFAASEACAPGVIDIMADKFSKRFVSACKENIRRAIAYAGDPNVDTVVIAACWYYYMAAYADLDHFGEPAPLKGSAFRVFGELTEMIRRFVGEGKKVYVVLDIPIGPHFDPHLIVQRRVQAPGFILHLGARDRSEIDRALQPISNRLSDVARVTGAHIIDPMEYLCDRQVCPVVSDSGEPIYRDMWNLRPSYVATSAQFMDEVMDDSPVELVHSH